MLHDNQPPASKLTTFDVRLITLCRLHLLDAFCFVESKDAVLACEKNKKLDKDRSELGTSLYHDETFAR